MSTVYILPDDDAQPIIAFHVTMNESHKGETTLADQPVEDGSVITDHLIHAPVQFEFDAIVTNTPIGSTFDEQAVDVSKKISVPIALPNGEILPYQQEILGRSLDREANRPQETYDALTRLRLSGATCTVITSLREYTSMVLISESGERPPMSAGRVQFHCVLRQIVVVATETVSAPQPKEPRGAQLQKKGAQAGEDKPFRELLGVGPNESLAKATLRMGLGGMINRISGASGFGAPSP